MENIQIFELVSMILGVAGTLLVTYKNKAGFLVWIIGNFLWLSYGFITGQYFLMIQYIIFTGLAIFGFLKWHGDEHKTPSNKLKIKRGKK